MGHLSGIGHHWLVAFRHVLGAWGTVCTAIEIYCLGLGRLGLCIMAGTQLDISAYRSPKKKNNKFGVGWATSPAETKDLASFL